MLGRKGMQVNTMTRRIEPNYIQLLETGVLKERAKTAHQHLSNCNLCPRYCHVDRLRTSEGPICRIGERARVHSFGAHHGEEDPLSGWRGSGTIFFSSCNLHCVYCQNWEISQKRAGRDVTPDEIASMMLQLQSQGCHNINFVSPSHVVAQILAAVLIAAQEGLHVPLVYNTGGYDSLEALALLDGVIDIYLADMKYGDSHAAYKYSWVRDYVEVNQAAVKEMYRQVGDLVWDEDGLAQRGLLIRHLVLPGGKGGAGKVLRFIATEISAKTYVNLMDHYSPCYRADDYPPLQRRVDSAEYHLVLDLAEKCGVERLDEHRGRMRSGI
jgi:putative pyruvate formate lyase activating enzyme